MQLGHFKGRKQVETGRVGLFHLTFGVNELQQAAKVNIPISAQIKNILRDAD